MPNDSSAVSNYLRGLYAYQPLPLAEEERLAGMIQAGDKNALDKLVRHNLRFVVSVIKSTPAWHHGSVPFEDLIAMGNEALLKAAHKWRPRNGAKFITYAKPFIIKGVRRALDNEWNMIRVPVNVAEEIRRMKYHERAMTQDLGRDPTDEELADALEIHVKKISNLREYLQREPTSLETFNPEKFQEDADE